MEIISRVFCQALPPAFLDEIVEGVQAQGIELHIEQTHSASAADPDWYYAILEYSRKRKIAIWCFRREGVGANEFHYECKAMNSLLQNIPQSKQRELVESAINESQEIYKTQFEIEDVESPLFDMNSAILIFLKDNFEGMIQIDEEGFYDQEDELLIPLGLVAQEPSCE